MKDNDLIRRVDALQAAKGFIGAETAITPARAAHVNETPKSEHDAGNVLTAAQAREAALHIENAKRLRRYDWQEWTAQDIEDAEGIICAYLALISEART